MGHDRVLLARLGAAAICAEGITTNTRTLRVEGYAWALVANRRTTKNRPKAVLYGENENRNFPPILPQSGGYFCKPLILLASPRGFEPLLPP